MWNSCRIPGRVRSHWSHKRSSCVFMSLYKQVAKSACVDQTYWCWGPRLTPKLLQQNGYKIDLCMCFYVYVHVFKIYMYLFRIIYLHMKCTYAYPCYWTCTLTSMYLTFNPSLQCDAMWRMVAAAERRNGSLQNLGISSLGLRRKAGSHPNNHWDGLDNQKSGTAWMLKEDDVLMEMSSMATW